MTTDRDRFFRNTGLPEHEQDRMWNQLLREPPSDAIHPSPEWTGQMGEALSRAKSLPSF